MIQHSGLSHRSIYDSFSKFQRTASDHKFRTKSFRVKTVNQQIQQHLTTKIGLPVIFPNHSQAKFKPLETVKNITGFPETCLGAVKKRTQSYKIIEKNYEEELNQYGVDSQFLMSLFKKKCQETETKYQEHKYQVFLKNLAQRLCRNKKLIINQMGFGHKSLEHFFQWFTQWDSHISELDLTYAEELLKDAKLRIITSLLTTDKKLMKLILSNSSLEGHDIKEIFELVNEQKQLFALDLSNVNSQNLNRLGNELPTVQQFFTNNRSVAIVKLDNLYLRREGFQHLTKGITLKTTNPLKILSLANNHISGAKVCQPFYALLRSGLTHLNLSVNPLGEQFFVNLPRIKSGTIKQLNLSETSMNSENLYGFLENLEECRSLVVLKLDNNDFSHHWFGKIGQKLQINSSIQWLSMNQCQIRYLLPFLEGLMHQKYLKRLDACGNNIDCDELPLNKIVQFFTHNKFLQDLRLKFCNLSEQVLVKFCEGLCQNRRLKILDISENNMEDYAANHLLKMLEKNMTVQQIGIQKLQLSQQMKKQVQLKLEENNSLRQKDRFSKLREETKQMKSKDVYSWQDVEQYEEEQARLAKKVKMLTDKTDRLENILKNKKQQLSVMIKDFKDEDGMVEASIRTKLRIHNEAVNNAQKEVNKLKKKEQRMKQEAEEERLRITEVQARIKKVNEDNKRRQNELQDQLRNYKYYQQKRARMPSPPSPKKHTHTHK